MEAVTQVSAPCRDAQKGLSSKSLMVQAGGGGSGTSDQRSFSKLYTSSHAINASSRNSRTKHWHSASLCLKTRPQKGRTLVQGRTEDPIHMLMAEHPISWFLAHSPFPYRQSEKKEAGGRGALPRLLWGHHRASLCSTSRPHQPGG